MRRIITIHNSPGNLKPPAHVKRLQIELADVSTADISTHFNDAYAFIEEGRRRGQGVRGGADASVRVAARYRRWHRHALRRSGATTSHAFATLMKGRQALISAPPFEAHRLMIHPLPTATSNFVLNLCPSACCAAVLVHCGAGVSRSAALVMSYLMRARLWSAKKARDHCVQRRSLVCPNDGFWRVLCSLEGTLGIQDRCVCVGGCGGDAQVGKRVQVSLIA